MSAFSLDDSKTAPAQPGASSHDLLCLLIESIGKHSPEENPAELQRFQERLAAENKRLASNAEQSRSAVAAVIDLMASHHEAVKQDHKVYADELSKAMRMMAETIGFVSQSSQAAVHQLSIIEKSLEEVTASSDATRLRSKLGVCLKMIREQSDTLRTQSEEHVSQLKSFAAASIVGQTTNLPDEPLDPVTGLPTRAYAENLIEERMSRKTDCLVGLVTINRFLTLKGRFGQPAIDDLIKTVAKQLAQRLPEATTLCRWSANSFIAVTDVTSSYAETSQQWQKVGGLKVQKQVDDAFVILHTSHMLEHVRALSSKRALIQNLDRFATLKSGELAA